MTLDYQKLFEKYRRPAMAWAKGWATEDIFKKLNFYKPIEFFNEYLKNPEEEALLGVRTSSRMMWEVGFYIHIALKEKRLDVERMQRVAQYVHTTIEVKTVLVETYPHSLLLTKAAQFLSFCALANAREITIRVGDLLYRGLDTPLLDMRINEEHDAGSLFRHFWFLMHLFCDFRQLPLDVSQYSYPNDMAPYDSVLADWRTTNLSRVNEHVLAMADFHLEHAGYRSHDDVDEFDVEPTFVFPFEILAYLRFREWLGLENPAEFDHPLMRHALGTLPDAPAEQPPRDELLERVIERFSQRHPQAFVPLI